MNISLFFLAILTIFEAILCFIVYLHNPRERVNRLFALFIFSIGLWTISNFLADFLTSLFWTKFTYLAGISTFYSLVLFTEVFPKVYFPFPNFLKKSISIFAIILGALLFFPGGLLVSRVESYGAGVNVITGPFFILLTLYYLLSLIFTVYTLAVKLRHSLGIDRIQLEYFASGLIVSSSLVIGLNILIPLVSGSYHSSQFGPYGLIFLIVLTTFAIVRFNLFNITVIATEVFASLLILILLVQVFISEETVQRASSSVVLVMALVLSFFLIRSMLREVRQKEELARLSKRLEDTNQELKRLDETKSEFVSIASHQLRTPLTVIKGYLSMLQEESFGKIPVKQQEPLEKVYESANRLIELVENLLSVSRIESGRMKYNFQPVQMEDMVASVVDELSSNAKKKKLNLEYDAPKSALPKINIDQDKIRQVMMNLVDNAIKYTKHGTVSVSIRKENGEAGSRVLVPSLVFEVRDTGNGVRPDDKDRLFQKFIRGQGSSLVHTEGTGLGLYVGRMMVEAHGGNIWVDSKGEGLGSTFAFALPLVRPSEGKSASANFESLVKGL